MTFPKIYSGKFCQKLFLVIWANYCWRHHFLAKVILVKLKILYILMQWLKCFCFFWNIFLYCKKIMSFLELSSTTFFMCILQTQSTRRNTSITKKLKKMSTHDFHDDVIKWWQKWHISIFLSRLIPYCQYSICTKFHVKWTENFWNTACFFPAGLLLPPPPTPHKKKLWDFQKSQAQLGINNFSTW